ncbi:MAG: hypothetical protein QN189_00195 [Armatimonadota bacterium]|nr:hypothetical protein [Armatimonadota bacterium]
MYPRIHKAQRILHLLILVVLLIIGTPSPGTGQVSYHRVAPKIYVPFDPNRVKVLHRSDRLFIVEVPYGGYAFSPRISPFGDRITFVPGLSTFAFTSVFLEPVRGLKIPGDVAGAPAEIKGFSSSEFSADRQMRTIAFICDIEKRDPKQAEREICVVHSDGTGLRRLTRPLRKDESEHHHAAAPAISEDGGFIVYRRQYLGYLGTVRTDGTGLRILVHQADGLTPVVLTRRAVFYKRGGQVWRANLDGTGERQLTREPGEIGALTADLEGRKVAYVARESGKPSVLKVIDGGSGAVLMAIQGVAKGDWERDQTLRLSGDGERVLFSGLYREKPGLYMVVLQTKEVFEVSVGTRPGRSADLNETGEIVIMTKEEGWPLALAFLPDETPPLVRVDAPKHGSTVEGEGVGVAIQYRDRAVVSGVDPQTVKILLNGRDVSDRLERGPAQARGNLGKELLAEGENVLEVRVKDRAGNEARQVVRFQFRPKR